MKAPKCTTHEDCFAHKNGKCVCLKETDFSKKGCPFYKHKDEVDRAQMEADIKAYGLTHGE